MTNILTRLDRVLRLISIIPVAGDEVDIMAAARQELRTACAELKKEVDNGRQVDSGQVDSGTSGVSGA